jgi:hypothetical protein
MYLHKNIIQDDVRLYKYIFSKMNNNPTVNNRSFKQHNESLDVQNAVKTQMKYVALLR